MTFHNPQWLWLLCALPLLAMLRARRGPRASIRFSSVVAAREIARLSKSRVGGLLISLRLLAAAAFIVALARPQIVDAKTRIKASGTDLVLAVDVSSSMDALDMTLHDKP
ncbi:MAG TPA: BatA domain-containing protein, partial [Polyangiales bacterium]